MVHCMKTLRQVREVPGSGCSIVQQTVLTPEGWTAGKLRVGRDYFDACVCTVGGGRTTSSWVEQKILR